MRFKVRAFIFSSNSIKIFIYAILDALRDAQERQALAIQRSRDLEGSYVTEIKSLKVENERLLSQINNEATSRAELEVYMQKEMQECSKLAEGYREEAHRSKEESAEKDKQMELLRNGKRRLPYSHSNTLD